MKMCRILIGVTLIALAGSNFGNGAGLDRAHWRAFHWHLKRLFATDFDHALIETDWDENCLLELKARASTLSEDGKRANWGSLRRRLHQFLASSTVVVDSQMPARRARGDHAIPIAKETLKPANE